MNAYIAFTVFQTQVKAFKNISSYNPHNSPIRWTVLFNFITDEETEAQRIQVVTELGIECRTV